MEFVSGRYDFIVSESCRDKFLGVVLPDLPKHGVTPRAFLDALIAIRSEIQLGRGPALYRLDSGADHVGISLHGYQVHFKVDQLLKAITIIDIEDPREGPG